MEGRGSEWDRWTLAKVEDKVDGKLGRDDDLSRFVEPLVSKVWLLTMLNPCQESPFCLQPLLKLSHPEAIASVVPIFKLRLFPPLLTLTLSPHVFLSPVSTLSSCHVMLCAGSVMFKKKTI